MFSEVIGLGLRYSVQVPVEVSLMPEAITRQIALRQKKPYLVACVACVLVMLAIYFLATLNREQLYRNLYENTVDQKKDLEALQKKIAARESEAEDLMERYASIEELLRRRERWPAIVNEIEALLPENVWIVAVTPVARQTATEVTEGEMGMGPGMGPGALFPFGPMPGGTQQQAKPREDTAELPAETVREITLQGHSVVVAMVPEELEPAEAGGEEQAGTGPEPAPDKALPFGEAMRPPEPDTPREPRMLTPEQLFLQRLRRSKLFDAAGTAITSYKSNDTVLNLKTFTMKLVLSEPIELEYK
jgi:hypothetical protein